MNVKNLCIIPARSGSKRIYRKNIKYFKGKPIIAYSIIAAIESGLFDDVMVSTDDMEIAEIAKYYGASIPFMRSNENSNDFATTVDVLIEVINTYKTLGKDFTNICCLYPTAPLVTPEHLMEGFQMIRNGADSVLPILTFDYPIWRSFRINKNDCLEFNWSEFKNSRSQDLPLAYHDAGQWYWVKCIKLIESGSLIFKTTKGLHITQFEAQDIDSINDWKLAELKFDLLESRR